MAALSNEDRRKLWEDFMSAQKERTGQSFGAVTKADLRAAIDGLDDFFEANLAAINAAIPQPARRELTAQQKALLLQHVIARRFLRS